MTKSKAQLVWRFSRDVRKKREAYMFMWIFMITEDVEDKLKFMYIYRTWITLYRPYFLNGLICSSLSNSENGNKIHSISKCAQNIFLSISERFLTPLTPLTPFRSTENIKDVSEEAQQRSPIRRIRTFLSANNRKYIQYSVCAQKGTMTVSVMWIFRQRWSLIY